MKGPCLCGDTECPVCGSLQGTLPNPQLELELEKERQEEQLLGEMDSVQEYLDIKAGK